jgi:23S rRNA (cytosine1962-C5)-methyltransferase
MTLPLLTIAAKHDSRVSHGHPWIYSNEIVPSPELAALPAGSLVRVVTAGGTRLGTATYNPKTLIAARLLSRDPAEAIDQTFFARRLQRALALREKFFDKPFYRLIHAEADGLPATIIDRYGDVLAVQVNGAGSDTLLTPLLDALTELLHPKAIVLRNESAARETEGLETATEVVRGELSGPVEIVENGVKFAVDLTGGQKTGWFYDQRDNRAYIAKLAAGAERVLDVYTYAGAFAVQCAAAGAKQVLGVDRSAPALALVAANAALNGVSDRVKTERGEAFGVLETLGKAGEKYEVVILDPPAFIKSRKDLPQGLKAYAKLARLGAALVSPGGYMFVASCSHNASLPDFTAAVARGLSDANRTGRIIRSAGAGADHPVHPQLPESAYLKGLVLAVD